MEEGEIDPGEEEVSGEGAKRGGGGFGSNREEDIVNVITNFSVKIIRPPTPPPLLGRGKAR